MAKSLKEVGQWRDTLEVIEHLLVVYRRPRRMSIAKDTCRYRRNLEADCAVRCGIGHAIPDRFYDRQLDASGTSIAEVMDGGDFQDEGSIAWVFANCDREILADIQSCHDDLAQGTDAGQVSGLMTSRLQHHLGGTKIFAEKAARRA